MNALGKFLVNGSLMTVVAMLIRIISVIFNVYISNMIGAEGLGLFTLITTVYGFALTVATSGINLATTRLVSEALANRKDSNNLKNLKCKELAFIVKKCIIYSLSFSVAVGVALYFSADFIGNRILFDKRTVISLRVLSLTLPATAIPTRPANCPPGSLPARARARSWAWAKARPV